MAPAPPPTVVADLRAYDPELRLRWARRRRLWCIERRMPPRHAQYLGEQPRASDDRSQDLRDGWVQGYANVMFVHPALLGSPAMWEALAGADLWRQGGAEALNRMLDEQEAAKERAVDQHIHNVNAAAASEMFDRIAWLDGRRVQMPGDPAPVGRWREESHPGFIVRDRRVTAEA